MHILATLIPPPVDPAHEPINIQKNNITLESAGQSKYEAFVKPVDVINDDVSKKPTLSAVPNELPLIDAAPKKIFIVTMIVYTAIIPI